VAGERDHAGDRAVGGVGICVSGGGLRAASFGLGALQALQQRLGLLRGERAARYLSAVSGGSYIAGAYTLVNCGQRVRPEGGFESDRGAAPGLGTESPFAPGSKEAEHLRLHCRYMVEDGGPRLIAEFAFRVALNLVAVAALLLYVAASLGELAAGMAFVEPAAIDSAGGIVGLQVVLALGSLSGLYLAMNWLGRGEVTFGGGRRPILKLLAAIAAALVGLPALATRLEAIPLMRSPAWLLDHLLAAAIGIACLVATVGVVVLLSRRFHNAAFLQRLSRYGTGLITLRLVQAAGILAISWVAIAVYDQYASLAESSVAILIMAMVAPLFLWGTSFFVDRISPHYVYRDLLNRCFSVIRGTDGEAVRPFDQLDVKLSDLRPPEEGGPASFPELLICAAVNVSDIGATPAGSNVLSCVFSSREMRIPAVAGARLSIDALERLERPIGFRRGWGRAVNLSTAIAMTGAAISPAMGKRTRNDLRALFAAINVRLGVWLPNPLKAEVRTNIDSRAPKIKVDASELVRELFGFHSENLDEIYVTDGGHYDNLGLVELMRERCAEIWCVDASGDRLGRATALAEALQTAAGELGAQVEIDLDLFAREKKSPALAPIVKGTHAEGEIVYADGSTAQLVVVKLGITERTPSALREYRRNDRAFPYHSTINQIYRADRFDAYRSLGWASTQEAIDDVASRAPTSAGRAPVPVG
jgi:hypothetical protein